MSFSDRLRDRREQLNISRPDFAAQIGVTPSAVGNYETGLSHPTPEILYRIFEALRVDPNYLYQDEFTNNSDSVNTSSARKQHDISEYPLTGKEKLLLTSFRALSLQGQDYIMQTMDMVKDKYKKKAPSFDEAM